jgi:hypothetical protein
MRPLEINALLLQETDRKIHALLFIGCEAVPPLLKLLGELNLIRHDYNIPPKLYIPSR